ncbi:MAG: PaaI family thioesterase [Caulobacterales bacterium]|nr:PaaI family thioesterase [Caulobacterales bacterium]
MSDGGSPAEPYGKPIILSKGPFAGWTTWGDGADPFETYLGPLCFKIEADGRVRTAFMPERHHLNGGASIHGGALMSFADFSLFAIAHNALAGAHAVTLTCNSEFIGAGDLNGAVEGQGEVLRNARSVIFVRGLITQASRPLLAFSGTLKKIKPSPRV